MVLSDIILRDTRANQPLATAVAIGTLYFVTDESVTERSSGAAWQSYSPSAGASTTAPYVVSTVTTTLPSSHVITAGAGISIVNTTGLTTVSNNTTTSNYVVFTNSTTVLPNSLILTAGTGITLVQTAGTIVVSSSASGASTTAPYIVSTTTTTLPNSLVLVAGSNITFTTSTTQVIVNATSGGGGGGWTFVTSWVFSTTITNIDFTGLSGYKELLLIAEDLTSGSSGTNQLFVSTNNGSTFLTSSGDYKGIDFVGAKTNLTNIPITNAPGSGSARSGIVEMANFNTTYKKTFNAINVGTGNSGTGLINTTAALSALRVNRSLGDFTGGSIQVFGKT